MRLGIATSLDYGSLSSDELLAFDHLKKYGFNPVPVIWDSPNVDWKSFDHVIIRSTWDYQFKFQNFKQWLVRMRDLHIPILNPVETVLWNLDKIYLQELEGKGIPIVPTKWLKRNEPDSLQTLNDLSTDEEYIFKPSVSAEARHTYRVSGRDKQLISKLTDQLLELGTVMVQPFCREIQTDGEWSLVFFEKEFSHAVLKRPASGEFRVQENYGGKNTGLPPPNAALELANSILTKLVQPHFFARVDLISKDGRFLLSELELVEPSLYFMNSNGRGPELYAKALSVSQ